MSVKLSIGQNNNKPLKKKIKTLNKYLNVKVSKTRRATLTFILLSLVLGSLFGSIMFRPHCNYYSYTSKISELEDLNTVCTGDFNEGIKAVFLNHFGIILWAVAIGWILNGVGFTIIG